MSTFPTGRGMRTWPAGGALFILLGVVWIILGLVLVSTPLIGTLAFVWLFGLLLAVGGVLHTIHAFTVRDWRGFLLHLIEGLLTLVVGGVLMTDPAGAAIGLTLLIGIFLLAGGVLRCVLAFMLRPSRAWVWLLVGGVVEALLGVLVLSSWPGSAAWVIGLFIGIRMLFSGTSMIVLGMSPRDTTAAPI